MLWKKVKSVTVLKKKHRSVCARLDAVMQAIRTGTTTPEIYNLMLSRVLAALPAHEREPFLTDSVVITPLNDIRHRLNLESDTAPKAHSRPLVVLSTDTVGAGKKRVLLPDALQLHAWNLPNNKTDALPGILILHPSCPLMLKTNQYPELGHFNTQRVTLVRVVLDPREPIADMDPNLGPLVLTYPPLYLVVSVDDNGDKEQRLPNLKGMDPREMPINLVRKSFKLKYPGVVDSVSVSRQAFPVTSARCITIHAAQGRTEPRVIADLCEPARMDNTGAMLFYTLVSRVRSLSSLAFLRPFPITAVQKKPGADLEAQLASIARRADKTEKRFWDLRQSLNQVARKRRRENGTLCEAGLRGVWGPSHGDEAASAETASDNALVKKPCPCCV
jgi:hypothetical protein